MTDSGGSSAAGRLVEAGWENRREHAWWQIVGDLIGRLKASPSLPLWRLLSLSLSLCLWRHILESESIQIL